jgi:3',5'-cyclic AMP phosphodiesterase CpdA
MMRRLLFVLIGLAVLAPECAWTGEPFTFVQIADTQLGAGGMEHDIACFRIAVEQVNTLNPDFVVICGDLVNNTANEPDIEVFKTIRSQFNMPCYCVPGNHDIGQGKPPKGLEVYRRLIGKDYFTVEHKGFRFVFTNTSFWQGAVENETDKQDAWFTETLRDAAQKQQPTVVVGHFPPFRDSPEEDESYFNFAKPTRQRLLDLLVQYRVKAWLAGHTHLNNVHDYQGVLIVASCATSMSFGPKLGYRVWNVDEHGQLRHEYVELRNPPPPSAKEGK